MSISHKATRVMSDNSISSAINYSATTAEGIRKYGQ
jgi:hypothetical protein